jgi:hypothetical protein
MTQPFEISTREVASDSE